MAISDDRITEMLSRLEDKLDLRDTQQNKDIKIIHKVLNEIKTQTTMTNGRVTKLEKASIGQKIIRNPYKTICILLLFILLLLEPTRELLLGIIFKIV